MFEARVDPDMQGGNRMEHYKKRGRIAGILLLASTIITAFNSIHGYMQAGDTSAWAWLVYFFSSVSWIFSILLSIGLITDNIILARVSVIVDLVYDVLSLIITLILGSSTYSKSIGVLMLVSSVIPILIWMFILIGLFNRGKKARGFCLVAFGIEIAYMLTSYCHFIFRDGSLSSVIHNMSAYSFWSQLIVNLIGTMMFCAAIWFMGLYLQNRLSAGSHMVDDASAVQPQD